MIANNQIQSDVIIFGGGIAGLWLLNALSHVGFSCLLFETQQLGAGQSGQAQGIIHGGIKYSLQGFLDPSTRAIADMPQRWQQHFKGDKKIDLSHVEILSHAHYLWSHQRLATRISHFLTSKALTCPGTLLKREAYPRIFSHDTFQGYLTRVDETVINPFSLIECLSKPYHDRIFKIHASRVPEMHLKNDGNIDSMLLCTDDQHTLSAKAQLYIFAAGAGNHALLHTIPKAPSMQRRPLHMVSLKTKQLDPLFAHYLGSDGQPRITITSHRDKHGDRVWYCGGQLAEQGVALSQTQQINTAKHLLTECLPWVDLSHATWHSFFIDRAEVEQPHNKRPVSFFAAKQKNHIVVWPTKLALTPAMADHVLQRIKDDAIMPRAENITALANWPKSRLGEPTWEIP
jgi:glycerol-3-phosphate dehydrogenase